MSIARQPSGKQASPTIQAVFRCVRAEYIQQPIASIRSKFSQENGNTTANSSSVEAEKRTGTSAVQIGAVSEL
jgi:hypothetical protein